LTFSGGIITSEGDRINSHKAFSEFFLELFSRLIWGAGFGRVQAESMFFANEKH